MVSITDFYIEAHKLEEINQKLINYQYLDFHQIVWIKNCDDDIICTIDFKEYKIRKNQVIVIYPKQIVQLLGTDKIEGFLFTVENSVFFNINQKINSDYLNGYFSNVPISLDADSTEVLQCLACLILKENRGLNRKVLMESYMQAFLFHISFLFKAPSSLDNRDQKLMINFIQLADKHFSDHREINFYADKLGVSAQKLNDICKKFIHKTPKQYLLDCLILEIKKEIRLKNKSLKEIAFDLGFNELAYFSRFFKRHASISPKEFSQKQ